MREERKGLRKPTKKLLTRPCELVGSESGTLHGMVNRMDVVLVGIILKAL